MPLSELPRQLQALGGAATTWLAELRTTVNASGGGGASWTVYEADLGATPVNCGRFTITDAAITASSKVVVMQAPGPYTGKGTEADEAEMDPITCIAYPASGSAVVAWETVGGYVLTQDPPHGHRAQITTHGAAYVDRPPRTLVKLGAVVGNVKFQYQVAS